MDIHDPNPGLWSRIEKDLPGRERRLGAFLWRAAAVIIVVSAATDSHTQITWTLPG
ncbi:MAG: hypothetical protein MZV63_54530 [Marinilabiliales bacterium]|nr:hypothetical protein [Marinilabiliales bacterium]